MTTQEILQSSHGDSAPVEHVLSPDTPMELRNWAQQITQRSSSELSQSAEDAFSVGAFTCMVEELASSIERVQNAYSQGGRYTPTS